MAPRVTAEQKVRRDAAIIRDRATGLTWATIAQRNGLSERQFRVVWVQRRSAGIDLLDADPMDALLEGIGSLRTRGRLASPSARA